MYKWLYLYLWYFMKKFLLICGLIVHGGTLLQATNCTCDGCDAACGVAAKDSAAETKQNPAAGATPGAAPAASRHGDGGHDLFGGSAYPPAPPKAEPSARGAGITPPPPPATAPEELPQTLGQSRTPLSPPAPAPGALPQTLGQSRTPLPPIPSPALAPEALPPTLGSGITPPPLPGEEQSTPAQDSQQAVGKQSKAGDPFDFTSLGEDSDL